MNNPPPLVTIQCLVYNHEPFLRQCLDGFVMQQTNFPFEAIVHDDASTDGSAAIIREYAGKYPHIIKPIYETENRYSKGDGSLRKIMYVATRGKYVAMCEGDDYWVSPHKLQKQVDFLEKHPDYSICFCRAKYIFPDPDKILYYPSNLQEATYTLEDMKKKNPMCTCSVMYRWRFAQSARPCYEDLVPLGITPGDWILHLLHAQMGKAYYDPEVMAHYRIQPGGAWYDIGKKDSFYLKNGYGLQKFFHVAESLFGGGFEGARDSYMKDTIFACVSTGDFELLSRLKRDFPQAYKSTTAPMSKEAFTPPTREQAFAQRYARLIEASPVTYRLSRIMYNILRKKHNI